MHRWGRVQREVKPGLEVILRGVQLFLQTRERLREIIQGAIDPLAPRQADREKMKQVVVLESLRMHEHPPREVTFQIEAEARVEERGECLLSGEIATVRMLGRRIREEPGG